MNEDKKNVGDTQQQYLDQISESCSQLDSRNAIDRVINHYINLINQKPHNYIDLLRLSEKDNLGKYGKDVVTLIHQQLLSDLYSKNYDRINKQNLPKKIMEYISEDFDRAIKHCHKGNSKFLSFENYQFLSYIEILSFKRFPVGHQNLEITGFSRRIIFNQPLPRKISLAKLLLLHGGNSPYFEMHFNPQRARQFNIDGWKEVFRLSSELLDCLPEVKGLFGGAWFFDEALKNISPELNYIRELGEQAGGQFYLSNNPDGAEKNALQMSKARQQAFEQGKYQPTNYLLIIPRDRLSSYIKNQRNTA